MAKVVTPEKRAKYLANRRKKYAEDPEYRARVKEWNDKKDKAKYNAKRKARYWNDPEYRERALASRRGRDQRHHQLKAHYGITLDQYNEKLSKQGGRCAICNEPQTETLCVDHCHATGTVRGLLCRKCNTGLGCYRDKEELMMAAIEYIRSWR